MNAPALIPTETLPVLIDRALGVTAANIRRHGFIYVVRDDAAEAVKIGFTRNPDRRVRQLQTASATPLRLICVFANVQAYEAYLHMSFATRRMCGEWFDDADGGVSDILRMAAMEEFQ